MIEWLWPWMALLWPLPLAVRYLLPPAAGRESAIRAPFFERWQSLSGTARVTARGREGLRTLPLWLIWSALLLAAARPVWLGEAASLPISGRNLMLAVDISESMQVEDMAVGGEMRQRVDVVRQLGAEFLRRREGDRVGLIVFGTNAYAQSPLSFDTPTVTRFLEESRIGFAGQKTAIGDAIGLAIKRLRDRTGDQSVLILLTDGQNTAGEVQPLDAARLAQSIGIRIYTIGIGAEELTVQGLLGTRTVNPSAELDEKTLQSVARLTGGRYFRARNPRELEAIYALLDELEPVEETDVSYRPRRSLAHWPVLAALLAAGALALSRLWRWYGHGAGAHRSPAP